MRRSAPWNEEETAEFRELVETVPIQTLAKRLQRSRGAIMAKAREENLRICYGTPVVRRVSRRDRDAAGG